MGFGFLVFGCMLLLPASLAFFYTVPISCILFAIGCYRLRRVNMPFAKAFSWACLAGGASLIAILFRLIGATNGIAHYAEGATYALLLMYHLRMLTGMEWVDRKSVV